MLLCACVCVCTRVLRNVKKQVDNLYTKNKILIRVSVCLRVFVSEWYGFMHVCNYMH